MTPFYVGHLAGPGLSSAVGTCPTHLLTSSNTWLGRVTGHVLSIELPPPCRVTHTRRGTVRSRPGRRRLPAARRSPRPPRPPCVRSPAGRARAPRSPCLRVRRRSLQSARYAPRTAVAGGLIVESNANVAGWGGASTAPRLDLVTGATDTKWLREEIDWATVEPQPGVFDFSYYDHFMLLAAQRGMHVLPVLYDTPSWAGPAYNAIPSDPTAFAQYVAAVVGRYGSNGSFWAQNPTLKGSAITTWELWNEPYLGSGDNGVYDPGAYARLVKAAAIAGRGADPNAKFLMAAEMQSAMTDGAWQWWVDAPTRPSPTSTATSTALRCTTTATTSPRSARSSPASPTPTTAASGASRTCARSCRPRCVEQAVLDHRGGLVDLHRQFQLCHPSSAGHQPQHAVRLHPRWLEHLRQGRLHLQLRRRLGPQHDPGRLRPHQPRRLGQARPRGVHLAGRGERELRPRTAV